MENKKAALDTLLEKTLKVIELQEKHIKYSSRCEDHRVFAGTKTIKKFIEKNLVEQSSRDGTTKIMFVGEYKYMPDLWKLETESQIKKVVDFIVYKNMAS